MDSYELLARNLWESTKILSKYGVDTISTGDYTHNDIKIDHDDTEDEPSYIFEDRRNVARSDALYIVRDDNCLEVAIYLRLTGKNSNTELNAVYSVARNLSLILQGVMSENLIYYLTNSANSSIGDHFRVAHVTLTTSEVDCSWCASNGTAYSDQLKVIDLKLVYIINELDPYDI
jgi:hypothetical protein